MKNIEFGKLIRTLRKQRNMTQETLASMLNVSTSAICKWEKGVNLPDVNTFQELSEIFEISLDDLHNPQKTLTQLLSKDNQTDLSVQQIVTQYIEAQPIEEPLIDAHLIEESPQSAKKARISSRHLRIIILLFIFLTLSITGILLCFHFHKGNDLHIYPYSFRNAEDEYLGTVFEVAYIYEGNLDSLKMDDPFIIQLSMDWKENDKVSSDITIMKASFYPDKELVKQWAVPTYSTYFLR